MWEIPHFYLDEIRLKNLFKNFLKKSLDIFKKSVIIDNVKRESQMTNKKMGSDLSAVWKEFIMTNREFFNAIINANVNDELTAH